MLLFRIFFWVSWDTHEVRDDGKCDRVAADELHCSSCWMIQLCYIPTVFAEPLDKPNEHFLHLLDWHRCKVSVATVE